MGSCGPRPAPGVNAALDGPDLLTELERIRLEQAKTNELLRQILVPLAFISSCCSMMLNHVQRLAASCSTAVVLLEDCSRSLRAVLLNTSKMTALLTSAATAATNEGLLAEHAAHVARSMNIAVVACLMAGAAVGLPYRWRACRVLPLPPGGGGGPWGSSSRASALRESDWERLWRQPREWWRAAPARPATATACSSSSSWPLVAWYLPSQDCGGTAGAAAAGAGSDSNWRFGRSGSGSGGSAGSGFGGSGFGGSVSSSGGWWWWWWGVGTREASVLLCRTRLTGGFLLGALVLLLWTGARWYLQTRTTTTTTRTSPDAAAGAAGGPGGGSTSGAGTAGKLRSLLGVSQLELSPQQQQPTLQEQQQQSLLLVGGALSSLSPSVGCERQRLLGGGGSGALWATMWRRSARLVALQSPAWLPALTAMGGSSAAWMALQLTWHAVLPYAIMALVAAVEEKDPAAAGDGVDGWVVAAAAAAATHSSCSYDHDALPLPNVVVRTHDMVHESGSSGKALQGREVQRHQGRGAVPYDMETERPRSPRRGSTPYAAAAGVADKALSDEEGGKKAEEVDDGGAGCDSDTSASAGGGGGSSRGLSAFGCGLFGLRLRSGSGSGCKAGYRRSAQLWTASRHRQPSASSSAPDSTTAAAAAASAKGGGGGRVTTTAALTAAAPSHARSSSKTTAAAATHRSSSAAPDLSLPSPLRQTTTAIGTTAATPLQSLPLLRQSLATPKPGCTAVAAPPPTWLAGAARTASRPLLAALWLYGGPVLLGAMPVLPFRCLWGGLMAAPSLLTTSSCLVALLAVAVVVVVTVGSRPPKR